MAVKIDDTRRVSNFCLSQWLFEMLPAGTYYLTLAVQWNGPQAEKPHILFVRECDDGRLSGMSIEEPTNMKGLRTFAETHGFEATDEARNVFVRRK